MMPVARYAPLTLGSSILNQGAYLDWIYRKHPVFSLCAYSMALALR